MVYLIKTAHGIPYSPSLETLQFPHTSLKVLIDIKPKVLKATDKRTNHLIKSEEKAMDKGIIPKTIYSFVHSLGFVVKYHCSVCYINFCQITILTQTHRSELVQYVSTQDRIYGFMPIGIVD